MIPAPPSAAIAGSTVICSSGPESNARPEAGNSTLAPNRAQLDFDCEFLTCFAMRGANVGAEHAFCEAVPLKKMEFSGVFPAEIARIGGGNAKSGKISATQPSADRSVYNLRQRTVLLAERTMIAWQFDVDHTGPKRLTEIFSQNKMKP